MQISRTHDKFYASESHKHNTKESFKFIGEVVNKYVNGGGVDS